MYSVLANTKESYCIPACDETKKSNQFNRNFFFNHNGKEIGSVLSPSIVLQSIDPSPPPSTKATLKSRRVQYGTKFREQQEKKKKLQRKDRCNEYNDAFRSFIVTFVEQQEKDEKKR